VQDIEGTEVVWQMPYGQEQKPKGLLLAFHGCSHGAIDWWPKGSGCAECIGVYVQMHRVVCTAAAGMPQLSNSVVDSANC
jgi:hypothetical protein